MTSQKIVDQREAAHFRILHLLEQRPDATQREIAEALGVSLGAVNFCVRVLVEKGHLKIASFKGARNKLGYAYALTPEGVTKRTMLAARFIKRKLAEYEAIRAEIELLKEAYPLDAQELDQSR